MKKNPELTAQTRQNLLDAFWKQYEQKDISKITVSDITNTAGYCRSTFYEYFKDVPEMLETVEDNIIRQCVSDVATLFPCTSMEQIHKAVEGVHKSHGQQFDVLLVRNKNMNFYNKLKAAVVDAVLVFCGVSEEDTYAPYVIEFCVSGYLNCFMRWYADGCQTPLEETGMVIFNLLRHGVLPEGKRYMDSAPYERLMFTRD